MAHLRSFRPGDEPALAEICLRTADTGSDATGILDDDDIWAAVFVLPYVARHPELAVVVETDDGRVAGYAVATGRVGVCIATSGPGATNLVTPLADANLDSVPMVAITGQINSALIGTDGFQEADIRGITMPVTKHNYLITNADDIPRAIAEAFHIASTGRPGPVLVDISKDALQAQTTFTWPTRLDLPGYKPTTRPHAKQSNALVDGHPLQT